MDERKEKLEAKLRANKERLERLSYLNRLPEDLRAYLSEKKYIGSLEKKEVTELFWVKPEGIGELDYKPEGYKFQEFSWRKDLVFVAQSLGDKYDQEQAFFAPFMYNPIYCVEFGWVRKNLKVLFKVGDGDLAVITTDLSVGIVLSNYCGYLLTDPNPSEIVYELAFWGFYFPDSL